MSAIKWKISVFILYQVIKSEYKRGVFVKVAFKLRTRHGIPVIVLVGGKVCMGAPFVRPQVNLKEPL